MTISRNILYGFILFCIWGTQNLNAHDNVVVVPFGNSETTIFTETTNIRPSFRIISTSPSEDEAPISGRLEYTADSFPSPKSVWGKVCDDCFEGGHGDCPSATGNSLHSAAIAVCKDLGFDTGTVQPDGAATATGALDFILDNVVCADNSNSFSDCSSAVHGVGGGICSLGDEVTIACSVEEIVVEPTRIELADKSASCGQPEGRVNLLPNEYNILETGEPPTISPGNNGNFDLWDRSIVDMITGPIIVVQSSVSNRIIDRAYNCAFTTLGDETIDVTFTADSGVMWRITGDITVSGTSNFSVTFTNWVIETVTQ